MILKKMNNNLEPSPPPLPVNSTSVAEVPVDEGAAARPRVVLPGRPIRFFAGADGFVRDSYVPSVEEQIAEAMATNIGDADSSIGNLPDVVQEETGERQLPVGETPTISQSVSVNGGTSGQAQAPRERVAFSPGFRLRPRGRATHFIESLADEFYLDRGNCGGKTSDSTVREYLDMILGQEVKVQGSHQVVVRHGDEKRAPVDDIYLLVIKADRHLSVSLRLLNKLLLASMFKPKTLELMASLKAKAVQYLGELEVGLTYQNLVIPGTVAVAMTANRTEVNSFLALGGVNGLARGKQGEQMSKGQMPTQYVPGFTGLFKYFVLNKLPEEVVIPRSN